MGLNNTLPWHLPRDLKFFKEKTTGHHIIMGRKTYESIGKPLPNRTTIIITTQNDYEKKVAEHNNVVVFNSMDAAYNYCSEKMLEEILIVGGADIFKQTVTEVDKIYLTEIGEEFESDVFFPDLDMSQWETINENHFPPDEKNKHAMTIKILIRKKFKHQITMPMDFL